MPMPRNKQSAPRQLNMLHLMLPGYSVLFVCLLVYLFIHGSSSYWSEQFSCALLNIPESSIWLFEGQSILYILYLLPWSLNKRWTCHLKMRIVELKTNTLVGNRIEFHGDQRSSYHLLHLPLRAMSNYQFTKRRQQGQWNLGTGFTVWFLLLFICWLVFSFPISCEAWSYSSFHFVVDSRLMAFCWNTI